MSLAEELRILEDIRRIKQNGGKLSDFTKYGVIKTEGSSQEIHEWLDAFIKPFDKNTLEKYYNNPEVFFEFGRRNMEIALEECELLTKYAKIMLDESSPQEKRDLAFLMVLHLTFTITDTFYQHDRLLESFQPDYSPLGKIYEEIDKVLTKLAEVKGYDEVWKKEKIQLLFSTPDYLTFQFRLILDLYKVFEKYPVLKKYMENGKKAEILDVIEKNAEILDEIRGIADKYYLDVPSIIEAFLSSKIPLDVLEKIKESKEKDAKRLEALLQEANTLLGDEYEKLRTNYEKIKYFKDLQEFTALALNSPKAMNALEKIILAKDYLKTNLRRLVKKEYVKEINELLNECEKSLPFGVFYFFPKLRKIIYLLLKEGYVKNEIKALYQKEVEVWRKS